MAENHGSHQRPHSHRTEFPEALETFFARAGELRTLLGPGSGDGAARVEALVREGLAARDRGDVPVAVARVVEAVELVAALAGRTDPGEGAMMHAMAARLRQALAAGAIGEARAAADVMRDRSGSRVVPKKPA